MLQDSQQEGEFDDSIKASAFFFNLRVKEVYEREGPFQIPQLDDVDHNLVDKGPYRLNTGVIYLGQWQADLKRRAGKGRQVWIDGSLFEGQWRSGKANGIGRLIHADGDIYVGERS